MSQTRPRTALIEDGHPALEAYVEICRTYEALHTHLRLLFKETGITSQQFNVLRILYVRDEGEGLSCQEIARSLIHRVPDMTRLLDRIEASGWISRERYRRDRRVVRTRLTDRGANLVEQIHPLLMETHDRNFEHMGEQKLRQLRDLLVEARDVEA